MYAYNNNKWLLYVKCTQLNNVDKGQLWRLGHGNIFFSKIFNSNFLIMDIANDK